MMLGYQLQMISLPQHPFKFLSKKVEDLVSSLKLVQEVSQVVIRGKTDLIVHFVMLLIIATRSMDIQQVSNIIKDLISLLLQSLLMWQLVTLHKDDCTSAEDLSSIKIQQFLSFLSTKLHITSHVSLELHSVSAYILSSSTTCPISSTFYPSIICSSTGIDRPCSTNSNITTINAYVIDIGATNQISHQKSSFSSFKTYPIPQLLYLIEFL